MAFYNRLTAILENWTSHDYPYIGEYWICNTGDTIYADGGVGDINHASCVVHTMRDRITEAVVGEADVDWEQFRPHLIGLARRGPLPTGSERDCLEVFLREYEISWEMFAIADGYGDACAYAMEHWGWSRLAGYNIETWAITPTVLQTLAAGVGEVLEEDGNSVPDEELLFTVWAYDVKRSFEFSLAEMIIGDIRQPEFNPDNEVATRIAANTMADLDRANQLPYYQAKMFGD